MPGRTFAHGVASTTARRTPKAVFSTSAATLRGVPTRIAPPVPVAYGPSVPSRTTTKSMSDAPDSGLVTLVSGRAWPQIDVMIELKPDLQQQTCSSSPLGTEGSPLIAPRRIASCCRSSSSTDGSNTSPVAGSAGRPGSYRSCRHQATRRRAPGVLSMTSGPIPSPAITASFYVRRPHIAPALHCRRARFTKDPPLPVSPRRDRGTDGGPYVAGHIPDRVAA